LIGIATTISFLIAPVIAFLNYRLTFSNHLTKLQQPGMAMRILALLGIAFLLLFSLGMIGYNWVV
jgi:hypothetical protein